jgi:hypothetical protein
MIISPYDAFLRTIVDLDSCRLVSSRAAPVRCRFKALEVKGFAADTAAATTPIRVHSCRFVVNELRQALNEGTLRAFRNADRFTTFKIFRRPGAL